jgi:hypothetical protein
MRRSIPVAVMKLATALAVFAAGLAFLCAAPAVAHAQEGCGGVEEPPCPKEHPPRPKPPPEQPELTFVLTVGITGNGHVGGAGISCPSDCFQEYPEHTVVVLVPIPAAGSQFLGWGGDCSGKGLCVVTMDSDHSVQATFSAANVPPDEIGQPSDGIDDNGQAGKPSDVTLGFQCFSEEELWIDELFLVLLGREGDQDGIAAFFAQLTGGASRTEVALAFLQSVEYRTLLVQSWYMTFLHRSPTLAEIAFWIGQLAGPQTDEDVEAGILGSDEYYNARGGGTNAGFIAALYQDVLGRSPTPAEQAQWDAQFGNGATRNQVALAILKSAEARTRLIGSWFQAYLGRAPTDVELNFYLRRFAAGDTDEQIQAAILGSQEFFDKVGDYAAKIDWGDGTSTEITVKHTTDRGRICVVDGNHVFPNPGDIPVTVEVTDPDGHTQTFDGVLHITLPPPPPPGKENVQPFGTVLINVNGRFVPLTNFRQVPIGTELDTTNGRVRLTSSDGSTGFFFEGRFKIVQLFVIVNGKRKLVTQMLLTGPLAACGSRTTSGFVQTKPKRKPIRHLWGNAKGSFRTKGKYASATVRGTLWETIDYCDGTLVIVRQGTVDVLDLVRNVHHSVTAGHSFFTAAP